MRGVILPFPLYVSMAWCLVKHRDNFTFTFIFFLGLHPDSRSGLICCRHAVGLVERRLKRHKISNCSVKYEYSTNERRHPHAGRVSNTASQTQGSAVEICSEYVLLNAREGNRQKQVGMNAD
jgi:hypothetical protein